MKFRVALVSGLGVFVGAVFVGAFIIYDNPPRTDAQTVVYAPMQAPVKILFVGDMQFDRAIRSVGIEQGGDYLFSCVDGLVSSADLVVGNLEGPITQNDSVSEGSIVGSAPNYVFTFPTSTAQLLARHHVGVVDLGNNHITNFGEAGILSTRAFLTQAGVAYFGGVGGDEPVARKEVNGMSFSFVSYNEFGGSSPAVIAQEVAAEHAAGTVVVVFAHWGVEYNNGFTAWQQAAAHEFVDAGADAVVGAHPHVVEPNETYKGKPIYYSLGNFIFDQYFSKEVEHGLALELNFSPNESPQPTEYPVVLEVDGQTCPLAQKESLI
jgi:poly-gamma-glutamate synthesis protein (capsule biosynthesis protein)